ncbi:MAG: cytochrome d ubiquinol oxidase subunit II [FCB group bacterium]|nr:cytochrome d ubiquinol oxidase subunit II [FCB group bacterium]
MDLNTAWFILIGVLIAGYAILDGFDLGVGILHLSARDNHERRLHMNAIGPVWDGNEVWLLTGGGALFAAFPPVYATVFSGFYIALMLVLAALIFRAVSFEFRGKVDSDGWRRFWDWSFGLGSLLPAILFGVAVGNILRGVPIDFQGLYRGTFLALLNPYALLIGLLSLVMFVMHGALYMTMKTDGELRERMKDRASVAWVNLIVLYIIVTFYTFFVARHLLEGNFSQPLFWIFLVLTLAAMVYLPMALNTEKYFRAFMASSCTIAGLIGLAGVSLFPNLLVSSINPAFSLSAYNASSSPLTLKTMLIMALIGMPVVIGYTAFIYRVFRGKTVLTEDSY